jgi:DNA-binding CsgD family transcriptional regulator
MTANTPRNRKPLTDTQRRWLDHIKAAEASGLTQKAYAQREGLSLSSLSYHKTRLRQRGYLPQAQAHFVAAQVINHTGALVSSTLRVHLPNGLMVEASAGVPAETVLSLVRALR